MLPEQYAAHTIYRPNNMLPAQYSAVILIFLLSFLLCYSEQCLNLNAAYNVRAENFQPRQHAAQATCCSHNILPEQYADCTIFCSHSHLFAIFSSLLFGAMFKSKCSIECKGWKFSAPTIYCPSNMLLTQYTARAICCPHNRLPSFSCFFYLKVIHIRYQQNLISEQKKSARTELPR